MTADRDGRDLGAADRRGGRVSASTAASAADRGISCSPPTRARIADGRPQASARRGDGARPRSTTTAARAICGDRADPPDAARRPGQAERPGRQPYIVDTLAKDGWNGLLRFYEGEIWRLRNRAGDDVRAAQSYAAAVAIPTRRPRPGAGTAHAAQGRAARRGARRAQPLSGDGAERARRARWSARCIG